MTKPDPLNCAAFRRLKLVFGSQLMTEDDPSRGPSLRWLVRIPAENRLNLDGRAPRLETQDRLFFGATLKEAAEAAIAEVERVARRGRH